MKDGSLSLRFHTQELPSSQKVIVMDKTGSMGWLLFREDSFQDAEAPAGDTDGEERTPSQRLRAVLYAVWQQRKAESGGGFDPTFDQFYHQQMEMIIEHLKMKLPPL